MEAYAVLRPDSPFHIIFPEGKAPILPGANCGLRSIQLNDAETYMIDMNRMTEEQVKDFAKVVAKATDSLVANVLDFLMHEKRFPIRASQVESVEGLFPLRMVV